MRRTAATARAPGARIALLRGINVGGRNRIPMAELRSACEELDWRDVRTHIQSGNLIFESTAPPMRLESQLEEAITNRFQLAIAVIVRTGAEWSSYVAGNPYPGASRDAPNLVMLALSKSPPKPDAAARLLERATDGERITRAGDAIWIHFPGGSGRSRITPGLLDRLAGSPVTMRNWRTVLALEALVGPPAE